MLGFGSGAASAQERVEQGEVSILSGWVFTDAQVVEMQNALAAAGVLQRKYDIRGEKNEELEALISVLQVRLTNERVWRADALELTQSYKDLHGPGILDYIIVGALAFTGGYWFNEVSGGGSTNIDLSGEVGYDYSDLSLEIP